MLISTSASLELQSKFSYPLIIKVLGKVFLITDCALDSPVYHPCGSAALGKVVGPDLRVFGIDHLRVCDASIFPAPISGHPQATVYAIAQMAADMID